MKTIFTLICFLSILIIQAQDPEPTEEKALMWVTVTDFNDKPLVGEEVQVISADSKDSQSAITNKEGKCWFLLNKGETYDVKYKEINESNSYSKVPVPGEDGLFEFQAIIKYEPPKTYTLKNVHFDTGKATLKPESYESLNELVDFMKRKKTTVIQIAGHTDDVGDDASNMTLSQKRAESVRNYLIKKGVEANRVTAKGYGETQFIAPNDTDEGRAQNRRTEVRIIKE